MLLTEEAAAQYGHWTLTAAIHHTRTCKEFKVNMSGKDWEEVGNLFQAWTDCAVTPLCLRKGCHATHLFSNAATTAGR